MITAAEPKAAARPPTNETPPEPPAESASAGSSLSPPRIGAYELQALLRHGPSGPIHRAWDPALARIVAIEEFLPVGVALRDADGEVVPAGSAAEAFERGRRAFIEESRVLARCDHPSLLRMLQLVASRGTACRVMPYQPGRPLREARAAMAVSFDAVALRRLLDDLLGAVEAWHEVAGPHGGIGPDRVLWLDEGRALLLTPGADAPDSPAPATDPAAGTSAGVTAGVTLGVADDIAALAALARFCVTGVPAADEIVPHPLCVLYADAPGLASDPVLLRAIDDALLPDAGRRPLTVAHFRDALRSGHRPAADAPRVAVPRQPSPRSGAPQQAASPFSAPQRPPEPRREGGWRRAAPALLALSLVAATGAGSWLLRDHLQPPDPLDLRMRPTAAGPLAADDEPGRLQLPQKAALPSRPSSEVSAAAAAALPGAAAAPTVAPPVAGRADAAHAAPLEPIVAPSRPVPAATRLAAEPTVIDEPPPAPSRSPGAPPARTATTPRDQCGTRTEFSLYRCMQQQCALAAWQRHPQCLRLKATDRVE